MSRPDGGFTLRTTLDRPYAEAVEVVREALADQGFGVLTEIDLAATMKSKLGVDLDPQVILGACRPQLAFEALQADASVAAMLPCNVVVRAAGEATSEVEAFDPSAMTTFTDAPAIRRVAADARERLVATFQRLRSTRPSPSSATATEES